MAEIKFNNLPFKTLEEWEKTQVNAGDEELTALSEIYIQRTPAQKG